MSLNKHHNWKFDDGGIRSNPAGGAVRVNDFRTTDRNVTGDLSDDELNTEVARLIKVAEERKRDKHRGHHLPDAPQSAAERMADPTIDRRHLAFPEADEQAASAEARAVIYGTPAKQAVTRVIADFGRSILLGAKNRGNPAQYAEVRENRDWLTRTLSSDGGSGSEGGYLIPPGFIPYLFREPPPFTSLWDLAFKLPVGKSNSGRYPMVLSRGTISYDGESEQIEGTDPSFGNATYAIRKRGSIHTVPLELINDSDPGIIEVLRQLINESLMEERERAIAIGNPDGTPSKPRGYYYATSINDVAGVTAVSYANLVKMFYTVDARYRADATCIWTMNSRVRAALDGMVDSAGRPLVRGCLDGLAEGSPERLFGKPIVLNEHFGNTFLGFGRARGMVVADKGEMSLATSTEAGDSFDKYQMKIRIIERIDHDYVNPSSAVQFCRTRILTGIS